MQFLIGRLFGICWWVSEIPRYFISPFLVYFGGEHHLVHGDIPRKYLQKAAERLCLIRGRGMSLIHPFSLHPPRWNQFRAGYAAIPSLFGYILDSTVCWAVLSGAPRHGFQQRSSSKDLLNTTYPLSESSSQSYPISIVSQWHNENSQEFSSIQIIFHQQSHLHHGISR